MNPTTIEMKTENTDNTKSKKWILPFVLVTSLFFFWGFVHNLDPILIPHLRKAFQLTDLQSSLVDSSVFIAYFLMAMPAGFVMRKYGYKTGIIVGLLLFGTGSMLFIPAANAIKYSYFLIALFVIASGLAFLETAANPYITILGSSQTATKRLNFAQSFNGLAAFIAPAFVGPMILSDKTLSTAQLEALSQAQYNQYILDEASSVKTPYFVLGLLIFLVAILFVFTKMPDQKENSEQNGSILQAFRFKNLKLGVLAQFFYVGAQVCVGSFFIKMATQTAQISEDKAAYLLGFFGLSFMLGRFVGTFFMQFIKPQKLLVIYALTSIILTIYAILGNGISVVYTLIAIAFFMSIMFPTIFSLSIENLGQQTQIGSSLLIMSIVGGAILPPLLGYISDLTNNIQYGYIVPLFCFVIVLLFGSQKYHSPN